MEEKIKEIVLKSERILLMLNGNVTIAQKHRLVAELRQLNSELLKLKQEHEFLLAKSDFIGGMKKIRKAGK